MDEVEVAPVEPTPHGDLFLRFPDPETAEELLQDYPGAVDVIGVIAKPTGVMLTTDDGEVPEMAALPGWHVNTRGPLLDELLPYAVAPAAPVRVWL